MKKSLNDYLQNLPPERRKIVDDRAAEMVAEEMTDSLEKPQFETNEFELDVVDPKDLAAS
ncbi:MAG: hypothetical protein WC028_11355 [Candidatus Obscuribacterales bacterium]